MIKKISFLDSSVNCVDCQGYTHNVAEGGIINKINELVDAVNKLDALLDLTNTAIQASKKTEPADPIERLAKLTIKKDRVIQLLSNIEAQVRMLRSNRNITDDACAYFEHEIQEIKFYLGEEK